MSGLVGQRVLILANPRSGSGRSRRVVEDLVRALWRRGLLPQVCWKREDLSAAVAEPTGEQVRCIVAAGGDGTLLEVLNRAPGFPVAVLPLGNENLVARFCGVGRSGAQVADVVAFGQAKRMDLARANGRLFSLMAGAGFDAEVVHQVHARRRGFVNHFLYVLPIVRVLRDYRHPLMDVILEENGERLRGALVYVFNLPRYALNLSLARGAAPDDGLLDVCVFERPGRWNLLRYLTAVLRGRHQELPDCQRRQVRTLRLEAAERVALQTDGDPAGLLPVRIEVVPGGMTLLLPRA